MLKKILSATLLIALIISIFSPMSVFPVSVAFAADGGGDVLQFAVTNSSSGTHYYYNKFSTSSYTFQTGDYLEYDVKLLSNVAGAGGVEIVNTDSTYFRDAAGWQDQNGISGHPTADLTARAYNVWYHRKLAVPSSMIGKTVSSWDVAGANNTNSLTYTAQYDNIAITNGSGIQRKAVFKSSSDSNVNTADLWVSNATAAMSVVTVPQTPYPLAPQNNGASNSNADFIGVSHINPAYSFGATNCIMEGKDKLKTMGDKTIKVYLSPNYSNFYRWNISWGSYSNPRDLAASAEYKPLFDDIGFNTYMLGTFTFGAPTGHYFDWWLNGVDSTLLNNEYLEIYNLTYWLMTTYSGTGKSFIIQNWETDWCLVPSKNPNDNPTSAQLQNCITWINKRQDAVNDARRDAIGNAGATNVYVYNALEVNLADKARNGGTTATNNVIPYTYCDFYSYSAYDSPLQGQSVFAACVDYLKTKVSQNLNGGNSKVYVGEVGLPSNYNGEIAQRDILQQVFDTSRSRQLSHVVYWQLYDNEKKAGATDPIENGECNGYWLIKPDGCKLLSWFYLYNKIKGVDDPDLTKVWRTYADVTLGSSNTSSGLTQRELGDGITTPGTMGGLNARRTSGTSGANYMYFDTDDNYIRPDNTNVTITIKYYDAGTAQVALEYSTPTVFPQSISWNLTNTNTWITKVITITDARLENKFQNGWADFRLNAGTTQLWVNYVKITKP